MKRKRTVGHIPTPLQEVILEVAIAKVVAALLTQIKGRMEMQVTSNTKLALLFTTIE